MSPTTAAHQSVERNPVASDVKRDRVVDNVGDAVVQRRQQERTAGVDNPLWGSTEGLRGRRRRKALVELEPSAARREVGRHVEPSPQRWSVRCCHSRRGFVDFVSSTVDLSNADMETRVHTRPGSAALLDGSFCIFGPGRVLFRR